MMRGAEYQGDVRIPGFDMVNLGGFPGIVPNPENKEGIVGEVWDGIDDHTLEHLDYYEGVNHRDPALGHYRRETIDVAGDKADIYIWNRPETRNWYQPIPSGDWRDR